MTLIKCPECGGQVSDQAPKCIKCGYPIERDVYDVKCPECKQFFDKRHLTEKPLCPKCGYPYIARPTTKGLTKCPQCNAKVSRYASYCPNCHYSIKNRDTKKGLEGKTTCLGCGFTYSITLPACQRCGTPREGVKLPAGSEGVKIPTGSVGKCPACGGMNTFDVVEESRKSDGFFGALGARLGSRVGGRGRFRCNDCGHTWEFGTNI
jgi:hypothetical protein